MLEVQELPKAPKDVRDSEERASERATLFAKSRLKRLSEKQVGDIEKKLGKWFDSWKKQTEPQRKRLVRYAEILEGVVQDSNVPFEGASNITLHYAAGMARTFRATFNKTAYQDEDIFYPILSPDLRNKIGDKPEAIANLEESFNHSFSRECNGMSTLKEGTIPCVRDGTLVVSGSWHREVRRCFDQRTYRDLQAFQKDYPDAEAAGVDEEKYASILDFFLAHPDTGNSGENQPSGNPGDTPELIVGFEYDHLYKNEPEYRVGPWAKFVRYPVVARDISECIFYGYQFKESREAVRGRKRRGEYYSAGSVKALDAKTQDQDDSWDKSLGFVEGITPAQEKDDKPVRYIDGCCLLDLDGDGIVEKYSVRYAYEEKALLSLFPHRLRKGIDPSIPFRMIKREGRLDGVSLIGDCEDLFGQIDLSARHENNVRILTTSPMFLANSKYKDQIDLGRAENVIRPGVTYWVDNPKDDPLKQLEVRNLDVTHDWLAEMQLYKQHVELVFGPTQGLSGGQTPTDPRAPARKTQMMLTQANSRIDDYLDQFMESGPQLAELHAALLFQYAEGPTLDYSKGSKSMSLPLELLSDPGLSWGIKRRSVQLTPEYAMARLGNLQQLYLQLRPLLATNDPIAMEIWNRHVLASGEPQADKFLLSGENLQKVQQSMRSAMQMSGQSPDAKAQAKGKESFHKEMGKTAAQHMTGQLPMAGAR